GTYQTGGRLVYGAITNPLAGTKAVRVQSLNGPSVTSIQSTPTNGDSAVRCVHLGNGAVLSGVTLALGAPLHDGRPDSDQSGGGVWCESWSAVVANCVVISNSANIGGGGIIGATIYNCIISTNSAGGEGAGADNCVLKDCTLSGNFGPDWWGAGGGGA